MELYSSTIMRSYRFPRHKYKPEKTTHALKGQNLSCGDVVDFFFVLAKDGTVKEVGWQGDGCALSQASAEVLCEWIKGKKISSAMRLSSTKYLTELELSRLSTSRLKCALLPLEIVKTYKK